jgi:small subunit ribosomal protein S21
MIRVQLRPNEPLESALRRFKRQCNYAGIFRSAKKYASFEKRSDKRRREARERIRNIQRALRKTQGRDRTLRVRARRRSERSDDSDPSAVAEPTTKPMATAPTTAGTPVERPAPRRVAGGTPARVADSESV